MSFVDPERRAALNAVKLRALVEGAFGQVTPRAAGGFGKGSAIAEGRRGWVLADDDPERSVGPALAWAYKHGVDEVHLLIEDPSAPDVARRALLFEVDVSVWSVDGRTIRPQEPGPRDESKSFAAGEAADLVSMITDAGADVSFEHGEITAEVLGLEMAKVVKDETGTLRLEVGVGRHDREAFAIVHGDVPTADALRSVIDSVKQHRHAGARSHPLNQLASERWLLVHLLEEPELVGLDGAELTRIASTIRRDSVKDIIPALAAGRRRVGGAVVLAASVGIDLDLVPVAADTRDGFDPQADLVIAVPERDAHAATRRLAESLRNPATVVTVPDGWRSL